MDAGKIQKWAVTGLVSILLLALLAMGWVEYQLRYFAGEYSKVVDPGDFSTPRTPLLIANVSTLSPDGTTMLDKQYIFLDGGQIQSVSTTAPSIQGVKTIDGSGLFVVPGLTDSHVHLRHSQNDLLLYLANGVTAISEMSGSNTHLQWRQNIEEGQAGPHLFVTSQKLGNWGWLEGLFQHWTRGRINIGNPDQAQELVSSLQIQGYDAIKLGSFVDAASYKALGLAAREAKIPLVGHLPLSVDFDALWRSEQTQLAHIEEIVKALNTEFGYFRPENADEFLAFVGQRAEAIAGKLASKQIAVSTTYWLMQSIPTQKFALNKLLQEIDLAYVNPAMVEGTLLSPGWLPGHHPYQLDGQESEEQLQRIRVYWQANADAHKLVLQALIQGNVRLLAGTDANNAVVVPGFSLHDELEALVEAGMNPAQSLRSATAAPADWMGRKTGRIEPGYAADLLVLRQNPLENISHTSSIVAVVHQGRLFDRSQLDKMLDAVRQANRQSRNISIDPWLP